LFDRPVPGVDDTPLLTAPATPRAPLAVRRAAEAPRSTGALDAGRRTRRALPRDDTARPRDRVETSADVAPERTATAAHEAASPFRRLFAVVVDVLMLGAIDFAVVYLTLGLTGLDFSRLTTLPLVPLVAFLLLLNGGYVAGFTTASGQTIGKMLAGIRVVGEQTTRVPLAAAVLRTAALLLTVGSLGIGYLPALGGRDRRAWHDRLAGTRVLPRR
jgi:uncharacterized RDD family membrane protein YckC